LSHFLGLLFELLTSCLEQMHVPLTQRMDVMQRVHPMLLETSFFLARVVVIVVIFDICRG
jgi:hypothetical protein